MEAIKYEVENGTFIRKNEKNYVYPEACGGEITR